MARQLTTGFESRVYSSSTTTTGEGQGVIAPGTVPTADSGSQWAGSTCAKCAASSSSYMRWSFTQSIAQTYFAQIVMSWSAIEGTQTIMSVQSGGTAIWALVLASGGELTGNIGPSGEAQKAFTTGFKPEANKHYLFELMWAQTANLFGLKIRNEAGEVVYEKTSGFEGTLGTTAANQLNFGNVSGKAAICRVSQAIVNDNSGTGETSWVGSQKVVLLKPTSDKGREGFTGGVGGTTSLFDAVNNYPPTGVATGSKTDLTQIYDAASSTTDFYRAATAAYSAPISEGGGGLAAGDTVRAVVSLGRVGNLTAATTRSMAMKSNANPETTVATGNAPAAKAETDPTGWSTILSAYAYSPTITLGEGAQPQVRKNVASTDATACDMLGVYVSYQPAPTSTAWKKELADTASASDAAARAGSKVLADTSTATDVVIRGASKVLGDATVSGDALLRLSSKVLPDSQATSDSLTRGAAKLLADALGSSDALLKAVGKAQGDSQAIADLLRRAPAKALTDAATTTDSLSSSRILLRALTDSVSIGDSGLRQIAKTLLDAVSAGDALARSQRKVLGDATQVSEVLVKVALKALADIAAPGDSIAPSRIFHELLADVAVIADAMRKVPRKELPDLVALDDAIVKRSKKLVADQVALGDEVRRGLIRTLAGAGRSGRLQVGRSGRLAGDRTGTPTSGRSRE